MAIKSEEYTYQDSEKDKAVSDASVFKQVS